ncbi:hypothetical protein P5673_000922 [Acropora cervicornis]|uniref:Uncharacterized protein n=1 Tax=Acropora cervicornis TaxID=6130 RepID=A0AAD9R530_ACRCE|nr:hypothetical protein P5673_000922 [Acropora cervicornis]
MKLVASASMLWNDRSLEIQPRFLFTVIQVVVSLCPFARTAGKILITHPTKRYASRSFNRQ